MTPVESAGGCRGSRGDLTASVGQDDDDHLRAADVMSQNPFSVPQGPLVEAAWRMREAHVRHPAVSSDG